MNSKSVIRTALVDRGDRPQVPYDRLAAIRTKLEAIVCTAEPDAGIVLLDHDGPTHREIIDGHTVNVYDHQYFSPLGDALIELYKLAGGTVQQEGVDLNDGNPPNDSPERRHTMPA